MIAGMESLGEAYTGDRWDGRDPRRVAAGGALFAVGALTVVAGILVVTTPLSALAGAETTTDAQWLAGVLAGLGVPAAMAGIVAVLPASRRERGGVVVGAACCVLGTGLFASAYPDQWTGTAQSLAFPTALVYFVGAAVALWFVFTAVTSYRLRNAPADSVTLELTHEGERKTVEVSREEYRRYTDAVRSDGGDTQQVIRELERRADE